MRNSDLLHLNCNNIRLFGRSSEYAKNDLEEDLKKPQSYPLAFPLGLTWCKAPIGTVPNNFVFTLASTLWRISINPYFHKNYPLFVKLCGSRSKKMNSKPPYGAQHYLTMP